MRSGWAIAALGLALAACGATEPDRFDLRTPGAHTGAPAASAPEAPVPQATEDARQPVTAAEKRVIKGWSDSLRRGRVGAAARYFSVPAYISDNSPDFQELPTEAAVEEFNRTLNCGSKLLRTRRGAASFVVGIFRLTERGTAGKPGCGPGIGKTAAVAFEIRDGHIFRLVQIDPATLAPAETPTPTPTGPTTNG